MEDWITTIEAAKIAGYHPVYIRRLLLEEEIEGRKFGTTWQVSSKSLSAYLRRMEAKGEKRGPKSDSQKPE